MRSFLVDSATASLAPPDYGAIMPPDLIEQGRRWQRHLYERGLAGIAWPVELGGRGLTDDHLGVWLEEAAIAQRPPYLNMVSHVLAAGALLQYGSPDQQRAHVPAIAKGDVHWCQLFSEPGAGSDLAGLSTRAVRDGDEWVVDGQKVWSSGARVSTWGILLARTNQDAPKHRGISFLLCDMRSPGIEVRPLRQMTGGAEFDEVFFTGARLPAGALLGPLDGGWGVAMSVLARERGSTRAGVIRTSRQLATLTERRTAAPGAVHAQQVTRLYCRVEALRLSGERQAAGDLSTAPLTKLAASELGFDAAVARVAAAGPAGMLAGPASLAMTAAPAGRIAGGTSQVQRNIIGERLLGLPKEPS